MVKAFRETLRTLDGKWKSCCPSRVGRGTQLGCRQFGLYEACTQEVWPPLRAGPEDLVLRPAVCWAWRLEVDSKNNSVSLEKIKQVNLLANKRKQLLPKIFAWSKVRYTGKSNKAVHPKC